MNSQEFEQFLLYELLDGHPDDVLCHMTAADIGEEFSQMLWVWSQHHQNPTQLRDNLQRFIIGMINRTVKEKNLPSTRRLRKIVTSSVRIDFIRNVKTTLRGNKHEQTIQSRR